MTIRWQSSRRPVDTETEHAEKTKAKHEKLIRRCNTFSPKSDIGKHLIEAAKSVLKFYPPDKDEDKEIISEHNTSLVPTNGSLFRQNTSANLAFL